MKVYQFILHRPSNVFGGINSLQPKMSLILFGGWDLGSYLSLIPTRAIRSLVQNVHPPHPFKPICACFKFTRMAVLLSITFTHLRFWASLLKMHTRTAPLCFKLCDFIDILYKRCDIEITRYPVFCRINSPDTLSTFHFFLSLWLPCCCSY